MTDGSAVGFSIDFVLLVAVHGQKTLTRRAKFGPKCFRCRGTSQNRGHFKQALWKQAQHWVLFKGFWQGLQDCESDQGLHSDRINLSPFTKDFRVWGALTEIFLICLLTDLFGGQSTKLLRKNEKHERKFDNFLALDVFHCLQGRMTFKDRQVSQTYGFPY